MKELNKGLNIVPGIQTTGLHIGLKQSNKDFALLSMPKGATVAGVFTRNKIKAAPVIYDQALLEKKSVYKAIAVNSGNANAMNGEAGLRAVEETAEIVAGALKIEPDEVLVCSTGVQGVPLNVQAIADHIDEAVAGLQTDNSLDAANAIRTTDSHPKMLDMTFDLGGQSVHIGGIAKGSGMIHPNMGTMLSFLTTDLDLDQSDLKKALTHAVDRSFNRLSIDGDTSTNDSCLLISTGQVKPDNKEEALASFTEKLTELCQGLAKIMAQDGEGATKYIEVFIEGAASEEDAVAAGMALATSPLMKTALFGQEPHWQRALTALGNADIQVFEPEKIDLSFSSEAGKVDLAKNSQALDFDGAQAQAVLSAKEINMEVHLNVGSSKASVWTCDFSYDYVKINSEEKAY